MRYWSDKFEADCKGVLFKRKPGFSNAECTESERLANHMLAQSCLYFGDLYEIHPSEGVAHGIKISVDEPSYSWQDFRKIRRGKKL